MSDIILISKVSEKDQNDFIVDNYYSFLSNAVHGYLFESLYLREIEEKYLCSMELQGFFAKGVLNLIGIDTSVKSNNRGIFIGKEVKNVANYLMQHKDIRINNIGRILMQSTYCK